MKKIIRRLIAIAISVAIIAAILAIIIIIVPVYMFNFNDHTFTGSITDKERVITEDDSYYLIFLKEANGEVRVVKNVDSCLRFKWDSSDVYGDLEIGKKYELNLIGVRIPFFSMYENIISYKEIV